MAIRFVVVLASAMVLCSGACGGGAASNSAGRTASSAPGSSAHCRADDRFDPGTGHLYNGTPVTYAVRPPSGGIHWQTPAGPGVWTAQNRPDDGMLVHSLEHGYVDVWYRTTLATREIKVLRNLVMSEMPDALLIPDAPLRAAVAATAWHHRLLCTAVDTDALRRFIAAWRNQGPERIPH